MENYTKDIRQATRMQAPVCDRQTVTELSSDVVLPDYQPEIKRLLRVCATVTPADKYVGSGSVEISGTVDYHIWYCGNDGALYCATQGEEYHVTVPMEVGQEFEVGNGLLCDVDVVADMAAGRVLAPRKLSLKCRLRSRVRVFGTYVIEESVKCKDGEKPSALSLQRLHQSVKSARVCVGKSEPIHLGEEILLESGMGDLRVIDAVGKVFVTDAEAGSGNVSCRGEVCLKLLCSREGEQDVITLLRRVPFSSAVEVEGAEVNCECCADGVCTEARVTVEENRLTCDMTVYLLARAQRNDSVTLTRDLYAINTECHVAERELTVPVAIKCFNGNFSLNETLTLEDAGIKAGQRVLDISGTPTVTSLENEKGRLYWNGKCRYQVTLQGEDEMGLREFEIPFRYEAEAGTQMLPVDHDTRVELISCRARMDGERIAVDAELSVASAVRGEEKVRVASEVALGAPVSRSASAYTVCYPAKEDTLWSVAKRYCRPVEQISRQNELSGAFAADSAQSLDGVDFLLV